jgi:hypothetical protein
LPGQWFQVLTEDGTEGFCFSYRMRVFEHDGGKLASSAIAVAEIAADPDLDMLLSRAWTPEAYFTMVNRRRIDLEELSQRWHFDPGQETGVARIRVQDIDQSFEYTGIVSTGNRSWRFEGTNLSMQLRSNTTLAVQFAGGGESLRTLIFTALSVNVDDLIMQETVRRERLFEAIYNHGPAFTSNNFGTITLNRDASFTWTGFGLLIPQYISPNTSGSGTIAMDIFLGDALQDGYDGAFSLRFLGGRETVLRCMYSTDEQGLRMEIVPESNITGVTVMNRTATPMVMYFFRDAGL